MKLYFTPGACSRAPHIVMRELGLAFEIEAVDLRTKRTASGDDFTRINPKGYVPALELDDGQVLTEGVAIVQYLADKYAPGTLAAAGGTIERARLQEHLNFTSSELHKAFGPLFNPAIAPEAREAAVANIGRRMDVMEQALSDGRSYLLGESFSVADPYLFVVAGWATPMGIDLGQWPRLQAFVARTAERTAVQAAIAAETSPSIGN